jgi:5'-3' exonuclease
MKAIDHMAAPPPSPVSRLHLIDATFELFRAYFAVPSMRAPDGTEVGAVRGLVSSILALLRSDEVTHVAAATDHVIESFRNRLFEGYKTGEGVPADLLAQFPIAENALRAMGITVWPMVEFEADDALASGAAHYGGAVRQVVILSPDKDLAQCVTSDRVVTHDRLRRITYDESAVRAKFGVGPESIPDLLALIGDSADGIPGIPGWGPKSAAALLSAYQHLERIPLDPNDWTVAVRGQARLAAVLAARRPEAQLYKRLATLRRDVPLAEPLDALRWRGAPRLAYTALCERLGFGDLALRPSQWCAD